MGRKANKVARIKELLSDNSGYTIGQLATELYGEATNRTKNNTRSLLSYCRRQTRLKGGDYCYSLNGVHSQITDKNFIDCGNEQKERITRVLDAVAKLVLDGSTAYPQLTPHLESMLVDLQITLLNAKKDQLNLTTPHANTNEESPQIEEGRESA